MKIAFIVQRYGAEILGGSEYHCRLIAERLAPKHQVEVLTTCAADYITWENEYAEGADRIRGVTVRRFANARTRDIHAFNRYSEWIFTSAHTRDDEMEWLRQQGPWCPALLEYLERNQHQYDVLIFFTYLYAPTVLGSRVAPHKSILVPTAHDEPAIRLDIYKELFSLPAGLAYNTEVERRFLTTHFSIRAVEEETVGCGVDLPATHPVFRNRTAPTTGDEAQPCAGRGSGRTGRRRSARRRRVSHLPAAPGATRNDVPAPSSPARSHRSLRRAHRRRQGLRRADRVLQQLRAGGRRRDAGAHGRQADAAPGGAVHPLCRAPLRSGTAAGARGRDGRRRAVALREPVAAGARVVRRRHADPGQRPQRSARRPLPPQQRRTVLRRPRRVHGMPEAAHRRSAPAGEHGPERPQVRAAELPVGRDPRQVRKDVHAAAAASPRRARRSAELELRVCVTGRNRHDRGSGGR